MLRATISIFKKFMIYIYLFIWVCGNITFIIKAISEVLRSDKIKGGTCFESTLNLSSASSTRAQSAP